MQQLKCLAFFVAFLLAAGAADPGDSVVVTSPTDGGRHADAANLVRVAANRYRLKPEKHNARTNSVSSRTCLPWKGS